MALITVGMPVYNGAEFLEEAFASIHAQSFKYFKVIVSDNASTDATPEIIEKWVSHYPHMFESHRQSENIGPRRNFEWVLDKADTPWIMFAAHDDIWSHNFIETLYGAVTKSTGINLSVPLIAYTDAGGAVTRNRPFSVKDKRNTTEYSRAKQLLRVACGSWYYGLYSREHLMASWRNNKDYNFVWGFDLLILLPFLLSGKVIGNNDAIYYARDTGISIGHYKPKTFSDQKSIYLSFLSFAVRSLKSSPLTLFQKATLFPTIMRYTSSHGFKLRRLARTAFRAIYDKSVR